MAPRVQRVAAYAVIVRDGAVLLSRLSPRVTRQELWTLPGGGLDHGEDPRDAVVREVREETGLTAAIGATAHTFSLHLPDTWRKGRRVDAHSLRIVYEGWVPRDAPPPRVLEVDGSTVDAAWLPLDDVLAGRVPTVSLVQQALAAHRPHRMQRLAAYAHVVRDGALLLTRISARGYDSGTWTLPGGGVDHGEHPADTVRRELAEECGLTGAGVEIGDLLTVHDVHLEGTAPSGRLEDFHGVHLVHRARVPDDAVPHVAETDGTTDAVAWVPLADVGRDPARPVNDLVRAAVAAAAGHDVGADG